MRRIITMMMIVLMAMTGRIATAQTTPADTLLLIDTDMGKITIRLFNDTPLHRDNFIKNVKEKRYDGLLFHRVIKQFMIQTGDINSKTAKPDDKLGDGDLDYTVPAEIVYPKYFHQYGMIGAAREGDDVNPQRASSAMQFYIVTGKFFTEMELDKMTKEKGIKFTPEQKQAYMLKGGSPHLDGAYTLFGEVLKGMNVVEKISLVTTNADDRPVKDIHIKSITFIKSKK
jgi:cyclophilin family peptidyl-prolyl cis-trans isomerase